MDFAALVVEVASVALAALADIAALLASFSFNTLTEKRSNGKDKSLQIYIEIALKMMQK